MLEEAALEEPYILEYISDRYRTQEIRNEVLHAHYNLFIISIRSKRYATRQLNNIQSHCSLFLIGLSHLKRLSSLVITIFDFMSVLSGLMAINNGRLKRTDKRRVDTCNMAIIKTVALVYIWGWEKKLLTHFSPVSHFYTLWKRQKTFGFLTFSGGIEMWHWTKMG